MAFSVMFTVILAFEQISAARVEELKDKAMLARDARDSIRPRLEGFESAAARVTKPDLRWLEQSTPDSRQELRNIIRGHYFGVQGSGGSAGLKLHYEKSLDEMKTGGLFLTEGQLLAIAKAEKALDEATSVDWKSLESENLGKIPIKAWQALQSLANLHKSFMLDAFGRRIEKVNDQIKNEKRN